MVMGMKWGSGEDGREEGTEKRRGGIGASVNALHSLCEFGAVGVSPQPLAKMKLYLLCVALFWDKKN